jgi:hypothetical protein
MDSGLRTAGMTYIHINFIHRLFRSGQLEKDYAVIWDRRFTADSKIKIVFILEKEEL